MQYDANSIEQLTFREGCRKRIGIYLGSADMNGVISGLLELVNNATDEGLVCEDAKTIELVIGEKWASCRDYGRGMPHGKNNFSDEVMINLLTENHSGAKFDSQSYGGKSRGLNGTGSAATCCSSDWFEIHSYRDSADWYMRFEKGFPLYKECQKNPLMGNKRGTYIKYQPSQEVFNAELISFNYDHICEIIQEYSYFNKGILFSVENAETKEVRKFFSENGLIDFAKTKIVKPIHSTPIYIRETENDIDIELILQWTARKEERFYLFSNGGENINGGTPITGIKTSLTSFVNRKMKHDIEPSLIRTGLVCICSVNLKNPIYDGQTKTKISNPELKGLAQKITTKALTNFATKNAEEFNSILSVMEKLNKAEEAATKAREQVLSATKEIEKNQKRKVFSSDKLKDAEHLGQNSTLLLVEGLSAASSVAQARTTDYGILALRGKCLNCFTASEDKIYENEEMKLLLSAMNIIPGKYNANKLRYGRIGILSDADSDGFSIGLLIMCALYTFAPEFIEEGRLYWMRTPLYIVKKGKEERFYYSDKEYEDSKRFFSGETTRCKGLGALNKDQARKAMFTPEFQRLDQLIPDEDSYWILRELMGKDSKPKHDFIFDNIDFNEIRE